MKLKVYYCVFENWTSHVEIESDSKDKEVIKKIIYDKIKNDDFDWELKYDDLEITKIIKKK